MDRRKNIMMDVTPNPVPQKEIVEQIPEEPKPTEKDIFKTGSVEEDMSVVDEPVNYEKNKKDKRQCTPKMKLHMDKMRLKAVEKKEELKRLKEMEIIEKYKATLAPTPQTTISLEPIEEEIKPTRKVKAEPINEIDYERIINGVSDRFHKKSKEEKERAEWEKKIRQDENEKTKKQYGELFTKAATDFRKKTYQGYGKGFGGKTVHPVFGNSYAFDPQSTNPFDKCFN